MNKKTTILLAVTTIVVLVVCLAAIYGSKFHPTGEKNKYSCNSDVDCVIKSVECKECSPMMECVNKDWGLTCDKFIPMEGFCNPSPPWVTNCKCINSKCADCRGDDCRVK